MDTSRVDGVKPPQHRGTPRSHSAVQQPHHAYMGKNGTPDLMVQADKAPMNDNVRPVGATKVMGWPARHLCFFFCVFVSVSRLCTRHLDAIRLL